MKKFSISVLFLLSFPSLAISQNFSPSIPQSQNSHHISPSQIATESQWSKIEHPNYQRHSQLFERYLDANGSFGERKDGDLVENRWSEFAKSAGTSLAIILGSYALWRNRKRTQINALKNGKISAWTNFFQKTFGTHKPHHAHINWSSIAQKAGIGEHLKHKLRIVYTYWQRSKNNTEIIQKSPQIFHQIYEKNKRSWSEFSRAIRSKLWEQRNHNVNHQIWRERLFTPTKPRLSHTAQVYENFIKNTRYSYRNITSDAHFAARQIFFVESKIESLQQQLKTATRWSRRGIRVQLFYYRIRLINKNSNFHASIINEFRRYRRRYRPSKRYVQYRKDLYLRSLRNAKSAYNREMANYQNNVRYITQRRAQIAKDHDKQYHTKSWESYHYYRIRRNQDIYNNHFQYWAKSISQDLRIKHQQAQSQKKQTFLQNLQSRIHQAQNKNVAVQDLVIKNGHHKRINQFLGKLNIAANQTTYFAGIKKDVENLSIYQKHIHDLNIKKNHFAEDREIADINRKLSQGNGLTWQDYLNRQPYHLRKIYSGRYGWMYRDNWIRNRRHVGRISNLYWNRKLSKYYGSLARSRTGYTPAIEQTLRRLYKNAEAERIRSYSRQAWWLYYKNHPLVHENKVKMLRDRLKKLQEARSRKAALIQDQINSLRKKSQVLSEKIYRAKDWLENTKEERQENLLTNDILHAQKSGVTVENGSLLVSNLLSAQQEQSAHIKHNLESTKEEDYRVKSPFQTDGKGLDGMIRTLKFYASPQGRAIKNARYGRAGSGYNGRINTQNKAVSYKRNIDGTYTKYSTDIYGNKVAIGKTTTNRYLAQKNSQKVSQTLQKKNAYQAPENQVARAGLWVGGGQANLVPKAQEKSTILKIPPITEETKNTNVVLKKELIAGVGDINYCPVNPKQTQLVNPPKKETIEIWIRDFGPIDANSKNHTTVFGHAMVKVNNLYYGFGPTKETRTDVQRFNESDFREYYKNQTWNRIKLKVTREQSGEIAKYYLRKDLSGSTYRTLTNNCSQNLDNALRFSGILNGLENSDEEAYSPSKLVEKLTKMNWSHRGKFGEQLFYSPLERVKVGQ